VAALVVGHLSQVLLEVSHAYARAPSQAKHRDREVAALQQSVHGCAVNAQMRSYLRQGQQQRDAGDGFCV
jgi:hypothetical protein